MIPISYNLRSLAVRKSTTFATVIGISLVVLVLASSQMLANGVRSTLSKTGRNDRALVLRKGADGEMQSTIEAPLVNVVLGAPGVKRDANGNPLGVSELVFVMMLERVGGKNQISSTTLRGIADGGLAYRSEIQVVQGRAPRPGADEVMIGERLIGRAVGLTLGGNLEIKKNRAAKVVGVFRANGSSHESEIISDLELARTSFGLEGLVSSITVTLQSPEAFPAFKSMIERDRRLGLSALTEAEYYEKQADGTVKLVTALGIAVVFLFSIGAAIGAMITMYGAVSRRKREIGTLRALGFTRMTVLSSFLFEAVLLAAMGAVIGALGSLCTSFMHFSLVNLNTAAEINFNFEPSPEIVLLAVVVGALVGVLGGLLPAVQAARISPTTAMRS